MYLCFPVSHLHQVPRTRVCVAPVSEPSMHKAGMEGQRRGCSKSQMVKEARTNCSSGLYSHS